MDAPHNNADISPNASGPVAGQNASDTRQGSIAQGKERAKAVMAASGVQPDRVASQSPANTPLRSSVSPTEATSNGDQSRKRSRSGSRKPATSQTSDAPPSGSTPLKDLLLDQYTTRDQIAGRARHNDEMRLTPISDEHRLVATDAAAHLQAVRIQQSRLNPPRIKYPDEKRPFGDRRTPNLRLSRRQCREQAEQLEDLVPVRLDLEFEKLRLRDTFTWNLYDRTVDPKLFVHTLVEDFKVPVEGEHIFREQVEQALIEQIQDYHPHVFIEEEALDPHMEYFAYKNDEMRVLIRLNITIGSWTLTDQFDWDINNPQNSPEEFASQMAQELALSGEFTTAISHSIREQIQLFTKSLYVTGHPFDGRPVEDSDIRDCLLPSPLPNVFRPYQAAKEFAPQMYPLADQDLERQELVFSREHRQQKRSINRRGGPSMPDLRERPKTWRTQIVSSVIPDAAEDLAISGIYRITRRSGKGRKPWKAGAGEDSDESEEEESEVDSPAPSTAVQGTARTRGMRGAASAAQAAMRANLARSLTPALQDDQDDSDVAPKRLIVKLKVPKDRLRAIITNSDPMRQRQEQLRQQQLRQQMHLRQQQQLTGSPFPPGMQNSPMRPPTTPGMSQRPSPASLGHQRFSSVDGTPGSSGPGPTQTPPLPGWLSSAIRSLKQENPADSFDGVMKWHPQRRVFEPRFRCFDCPGMLYKTEQSKPVENFRIHLRNSDHVERRERRLRGGG